MFKRTVIGLITAILTMAAYAAESKVVPDSARSDMRPNNQRIVPVAEFSSMDVHHGVNPTEMTLEKLTSNRPTIGANGDSNMLCEVESIGKPERKQGGVCVSARTNPSTLKIATYKNATGAPINPREELRSEFYGKKVASITMASDGTLHFKCERDDRDGHNTGTCKLEGDD